MILRCVAVDDEPFALEIIQDFVSRVPFLHLIAACSDPLEALSVISRTHPELLFLDIEMPDISGIRLAEATEMPPLVIFTTAHSKYAVEGFNLNALDYLLKPYSFERFLKAATKALDFTKLIADKDHPHTNNDFIIIKSEYKNIKIRLDEILYIEALDNYVRIFTHGKTYTPLINLKTIVTMLPRNRFVRIHKSFVVALSQIKVFTKDYATVGNRTLPVGRAYAEIFAEAVRRWR
jgi:DNA-binding LytR/AlgR family response regulator